MDKQDEERVREIAREEALKCFREQSIREGREKLRDFVEFQERINVPMETQSVIPKSK